MKKKTVHNLAFITILSFLTLFFVNTAVAQSAGPQVYRLIGTIQSKEFTGAVINDSTGAQTFYRLKEKLPDGSKIIQVRSDSIRLKGADGTTYDMYIFHETKAVASVQNNVPANPYTPGTLQKTPEASRNAPTERIMNSHGKRRQRRE